MSKDSHYFWVIVDPNNGELAYNRNGVFSHPSPDSAKRAIAGFKSCLRRRLKRYQRWPDFADRVQKLEYDLELLEEYEVRRATLIVHPREDNDVK